MWIVNNRKIFYAVSIVLVLASLVALGVWGLKPGIDFTGGTLIDASYPDGRPEQAKLYESLATVDERASIRPSGTDGYIVRMKEVNQEDKSTVTNAMTIGGSYKMVENTFDSIGPTMGMEALKKAFLSIFLVILGIVLYITFAFRHVSEPVSSWKYGLVAIAALVHDVLIPAGLFAVLGHFAGYEVDTLFVTALLVVLGFSVHDTIVVFDRVRENLRHAPSKKPFTEVVGESIGQTFTRSINTSVTTLIALVVLYLIGGDATRHFALVLIVGIAAGTYSSIFIGSPLLVTLQQWSSKKKA